MADPDGDQDRETLLADWTEIDLKAKVWTIFPDRTEAEIFPAAKERAAQRVGQSRIARVRVSRVSRLSPRTVGPDPNHAD